jgi:hypothetical protein
MPGGLPFFGAFVRGEHVPIYAGDPVTVADIMEIIRRPLPLPAPRLKTSAQSANVQALGFTRRELLSARYAQATAQISDDLDDLSRLVDKLQTVRDRR